MAATVAVLICSGICSFFIALIPSIVSLLTRLLCSESAQEIQIRRHIAELKAELSAVNMMNEFAKFAKIQRKVNKANDELSRLSKSKLATILKLKMTLTVVFHAVTGIMVIYLLWVYKYKPLFIMPADWLFPFATILSFPAGIPGAIGITCWMLVCSCVARIITRGLFYS